MLNYITSLSSRGWVIGGVLYALLFGRPLFLIGFLPRLGVGGGSSLGLEGGSSQHFRIKRGPLYLSVILVSVLVLVFDPLGPLQSLVFPVG